MQNYIPPSNVQNLKARLIDCWLLGSHATYGHRVRFFPLLTSRLSQKCKRRGYIESCQKIVFAARQIANAITEDIPELYVLGNPPASVVAFGSRDAKVDPLEVGDAMSRRGWHLNGLSDPKSVHIACTVRPFFFHFFLSCN